MISGGLQVCAWLSALAEACWGFRQGPELCAMMRRSGSYSSRHVPGLLCNWAPQFGVRQFAWLGLIGVTTVVATGVYPVSEWLTLLT